MSYLYRQHGQNKYVLLMSTLIKNSAWHLNLCIDTLVLIWYICIDGHYTTGHF